MTRHSDHRVPVVFGPGETAKPSDAVLTAQPDAPHKAACLCCVPRGKLLESLGNLFIQRARGDVPWFDRVIIDTDDENACRALFSNDSLIAARFRLG